MISTFRRAIRPITLLSRPLTPCWRRLRCSRGKIRAYPTREAAMDHSDHGLDDQPDQVEGKTLRQDRGADKQTRATIYPLGVGWTHGRRPVSSFKSNLSVIAASAKLIVFIGWLRSSISDAQSSSHSLSRSFSLLYWHRLSAHYTDCTSAAFRRSSLWSSLPFLQSSVSAWFWANK